MRENCFEGSLMGTDRNNLLTKNEAGLRAALSQRAVIEVQATAFNGNRELVVTAGGLKGIIPYEECAIGLDDGSVKDIAIISRVGKAVCCTVTGFACCEGGDTTVMLSRRMAQQMYAKAVLEALRPGDVIDCKVTHIERFGCFADVGRGISALLPIDAISVSRISHPSDRVTAGMTLRCAVRSVDVHGRLLLTHRELLGTWEENAVRFSAGETVSGIVRSVESYGVFVELAPNLAGLADPVQDISIGHSVTVYIKSIIPERMKIKLVIIDSYPQSFARESGFTYFHGYEHISRFRYSPEYCAKSVETVFD